MKRNVVLYGNSNQGKSTIFGYLFVELCDVGGIDKFESYFKRELPKYNPALLYTWIANKDYFFIDKLMGIRVDPRIEEEGLDIYEHGETAYNS